MDGWITFKIMKAQYLKISGHKNEKDFYKEFPNIETFMAKHGAALKQAQSGTQVDANANGIPDYYEQGSYMQTAGQMFPAGQMPQSNQSGPTQSATLAGFNNTFSNVSNGQGYGGMVKGMFSGGDAGNGGVGKAFGDIGKSFGIGGGGGAAAGAKGASGAAGGASNASGYIGAAIDIASGISQLKGEKNAKKAARRDRDVVKLVKTAYDTEDVNRVADFQDSANRNRKALIPTVDANALYNTYGTGSNALAKHGGEIMNTYAPGTLYDDLETAQNGFQANNRFDNYQNNLNSQGLQTISSQFAQNQQTAALANNFSGNSNIGKVNNAYGAMGKGVGTAIGTYFGGPLGGKIGGLLGQQAGRLDPNYKAIASANKEKQGYINYMQNSNGFQNVRAGIASAYTKNGGIMRAGVKLKTNEVGNIHTLSGGYLEPISYNPYSDGTGITSMIKGQSHEDFNGSHSGVLLNYGGGKAQHGSNVPDVEAEDGEPITEIDNNAVIFGDMKVNRLTVGNDPMFKNAYGKTFKKVAEGITEKNAQLGKERDKITYELEAYNPKTSLEKLKGNSLQALSEGLDLKYKVNDAAIRKLAAYQETVHNTTEPLGLNSGKFSRNQLQLEKTQIAESGMSLNRKKDIKGIQSTNLTVAQPGPVDVQDPTGEKAEAIEDTQPYNGFGVDTLLGLAAPWLREKQGEQLRTDQISGELNALADNDVDPVQARYYHPQLRDPNSNLSYQDQLNSNQADFNQLVRASGDNPQALAALAAQKYGANSKVLAEQFRVNQGQREQVSAQNQATLNDALMKNLQIADQQYVRQATAKSATKAVRQEALNSISSKIAQNRLENRTLQVYSNMFPDYSFDNNFRIQKTGTPATFNTQLSNMTGASKKGSTKEVPVFEEDGKTIKEYKTVKVTKNGGLVKAFRDL